MPATKQEKTIVISFVRMNPPTIGHAKLVEYVASLANRNGREALIFPSQSQDPKRNPLPFKMKVGFLRQLFPSMNFSNASSIKTPFDALLSLSMMGYRNVVAIVGNDRVPEFEGFARYIKSTGKPSLTNIVLSSYKVLPVPGDRDPDADDASGASATKMRAFASKNDFESFARYTPTENKRLARQIFDNVRQQMGKSLHELNGKVLRMSRVHTMLAEGRFVMEALAKTQEAHCENCEHQWRVFNKNNQPDWVLKCPKCKSSDVGLDSRDLDEDAKDPDPDWCPTCLGDEKDSKSCKTCRGTGMVDAPRRLKEADGAPKQPTDVDRLKLQQKKDQLMQKKQQSQALLGAETRELEKKNRETLDKLSNSGQKKKSA